MHESPKFLSDINTLGTTQLLKLTVLIVGQIYLKRYFHLHLSIHSFCA